MKKPLTPEEKDLIPLGITMNVLLEKALGKSYLRAKVLKALQNKEYCYKQDLMKELKLKHYKNLHEELKNLEKLMLISFVKEYDKTGRPVKIVVNKAMFTVLQGTLENMYKEFNL